MPLGKREISPVVCVVQARTGSTRLPGKVMEDIQGRPMLWHVLTRLTRCAGLDTVAVATTTEPSDDAIERWSEENGYFCYRGSTDDVLDRYYFTAKKLHAGTVVRVTSDCPLVDPYLIERIIDEFSSTDCDYASAAGTWPDGLDAEVFTFSALEQAHREARLKSELEHVTPYIWKNTERFKVRSIECDRDLSNMRWSVDDARDLEFMRAVYGELYKEGGIITTGEVLDLLEKRPDIFEINAGTMRNEGYAKSLKEDHTVKKKSANEG